MADPGGARGVEHAARPFDVDRSGVAMIARSMDDHIDAFRCVGDTFARHDVGARPRDAFAARCRRSAARDAERARRGAGRIEERAAERSRSSGDQNRTIHLVSAEAAGFGSGKRFHWHGAMGPWPLQTQR